MSQARRRRGIQVLGVVLVLTGLFAWNEGLFQERIEAGGRVANGGIRFEGETATVERVSVPSIVEVAGTVTARRSASLSSRVPGVVTEVSVDEGDRVREGQVLVRLSAPDLDSRGAAARSAADAARAAVEQAERDLRRVEELAERGAATRLERERAGTALRRARGQLGRALGESKATTSVAGYTTVEAPFEGIVVRRRMDPGDLASPGVPILDVVDSEAPHVEAAVAESVAARVDVGARVEIEIDALGERLLGTVAEVVPAADPASRTTLVKVAVEGGGELWPGSFVRLRLPVGNRPGLVVPEGAARIAGELVMIDVLTPEGTLEPRHVEVGRPVDSSSIEILTGVSRGERVAVHR